MIVEAHKRYTMPVCATADLTIWHKDGNSSSATAFELGDRLLATAGHVLINDKGSFPRAARVRFGYINGISVRRYDEDNIAGYIYVGDATGKNFNSDNDYGFIVWKEGVSDYVGYYGIDYSYGINTPCESYGYPSGFNNNMVYCSGYVTDKYYCTIETSLDSSHGQSGSPIFTQGGYAIGILHGGNGEATFGRQLETGLTSWLNDKGYFD